MSTYTYQCNFYALLFEKCFNHTDFQEKEQKVTDLAMSASYSNVSENSLKRKEPADKGFLADLIYGFSLSGEGGKC